MLDATIPEERTLINEQSSSVLMGAQLRTAAA
jgi:hypothetical protein